MINDQRSENTRRRIVVPLGQPSAGGGREPRQRLATPGATPPRKSRARQVLAILGLLLVAAVLALAAAAFFWWRHYQTTPAYSLALLVDAAQRNDMPGVEKIVDTDKIVANFSKQVTEKAAGRYGRGLNDEVSKTIQARVPALLPNLRQQTRDVLAARVKEISTKADQKPFFVIALAVPYFVEVTTSGDRARATFKIHDQQVTMDLERSGDLWKVVAVHDDALVERLVDELIRDLPAVAPGIESEIRKSARKPPPALLR